MKWRALILCGLLAGVLAAVATAQPPPGSDLVVHEWGTFLSMQGSDGAVLDGMYHEEHALPGFVHARSRDQLRVRSATLKGETPVIYFYTDQPQRVRVDVRFPRGIWTQWYPQASVVAPHLAQTGSFSDLRDGRILWSADIVPAASVPRPVLPAANRDALWNFSRDVDAAYVRTGRAGSSPGEFERFIFYRGLGRAPLPLTLTSAAGGTLTWKGSPGSSHLLALRIENGKGAFRILPAIAEGKPLSGVIPSMDGAVPVEQFARDVAGELAKRLVQEGLYEKEARAMVNTWSQSYFKTEGTRILFTLPRRWTDEFIPMTLDPRPRELVRVMVGRLEMLSLARERQAEAAVRGLSSKDTRVRQESFSYLRAQGRYVEPLLRRVLTSSSDAAVKTLCRRLLLADFVTELRAALHSADTGAPLTDSPVNVRAQLAVLLRDVGLDAEAKAEARAVSAALAAGGRPKMDNHESRHPLRAMARAVEASGDDAGALERYGEFIRFSSQVAAVNGCRGCHSESQGPRDMAWFEDWWAGKRYSALAAATGRLDDEIRRNESLLERQAGSAEARMKLAFLYEASGQNARARQLWAALGVPPQRAAASGRAPLER